MGASDAVEHLLSLGHRRIAAITGPRGWIATEERLHGYRGALAALVRLLQNQRIEALHVELETKLVVRESTVPVTVRA